MGRGTGRWSRAVDQGTSSRAVHPRSSPRCIRLALLGLTCEAPPAPSSVAMDLKAPRPASIAAALGLKPRRLMRSAADLDAGVEVEPGQRRLTGGRRARFPAEESQPDPVGRTPRPRPVGSPERRTSRCATRSWGRSAPAFPGAWTLRGTIVYPKAYPERFYSSTREVMISNNPFILFVLF